MRTALARKLTSTLAMLSVAWAGEIGFAQSIAPDYPRRLKDAGLPVERSSATAASTTGIQVGKTAYVDGQKVCGAIRITNVGLETVTVSGVVDFLEVHFPRKVPIPAGLDAGSTREWFKVADVPVTPPFPGPIAPGATATIDYCHSLCLAADSPEANSMRNVVTVTVTNESGSTKTVTTRSVSFPPPVLDCQACCLLDGSCTDTVPDECAAAGGLSRGSDTNCATTACTQACCLGDGTCSDETLSDCQIDGEPLGLGTTCATVTTTCRGACCTGAGCVDDVSDSECRLEIDLQGTYLGDDTACASEAAACPTGACCEGGTGLCRDDLQPSSHVIHTNQNQCETGFGGTYLGDGTTCGPTSCTEACCFGTTCEELLPGDCEAQGGDPQGPGTDCPILGLTPCSVNDP